MPYRDPNRAREYRRRWDASRSAQRRLYDRETGNEKRRERRVKQKPFAGTDGEGANVNGRHEYLMLRAGTELLDLRRALTSDDCLKFLSSLPAGKKYVAFAFDYDTTMILRDLPEPVIEAILDRPARTKLIDGKLKVEKVKYGPYLIDYLARKHLEIYNLRTKRQVTIHDIFAFFQSSFVVALDKWDIGTPEERALILEGKEHRHDLISYGHDETVKYNDLECMKIEELMNALQAVATELGYSIAPYEGAGCLASSMLKRHLGTPPPMPPEYVCQAAQKAYYGGWFEPLAHGQINETVTEFDIASAYPYAMLSLPCLEHGTWHQSGSRPSAKLFLARVEWKAEPRGYVPYGPLPHRDTKGIISRPLSGAGWYWNTEIPFSDKRFKFNVTESVSYSKNCNCRPFDWVNDVFLERKRLGKSAKGMVLKLGLNSLYGKFAQSVGMAPWANPVYAGLITATTRRMIYDLATDAMVQSNGKIHPIMFATDAVFFTGPADTLKLDMSGALGTWEMTCFKSLHIIQAGMYYDDEGFKMRTRGLRASALRDSLDDLRTAYDREGLAATITIEYNQLLGLRLAYRQNRLSDAGNWFKVTKKVGYDYRNKRESVHQVNGVWMSKPYDAREPFESVGYSKYIGGLVRQKFLDDALIDECDPTV